MFWYRLIYATAIGKKLQTNEKLKTRINKSKQELQRDKWTKISSNHHLCKTHIWRPQAMNILLHCSHTKMPVYFVGYRIWLPDNLQHKRF